MYTISFITNAVIIIIMFFVGHMVWAYILTRPLFSTKPNIHILLVLGILPDIDILFNFIEHRSITHSMLFVTFVFIPFFIRYRREALPYFIAISQHILFGDLIVGKTQILWPFGQPIGLGLKLTSVENIAIEGIGLAIFIILILRDKHLIVNGNNLLAIIPLTAIIIFPIFFIAFSIDNLYINGFAKNIMSDELSLIVYILHMILALILIMILSNGIRRYMRANV